MKKIYFGLLMFLLFSSGTFGQGNFISISPNQSIRGQTLTTTVTASGYFFTFGSAPSTMGDFFMQKNGVYIYPTNVVIIDNDHVDATWTIPLNWPVGNYDVVWDEAFPFGFYSYVPGGFNVGDVFISGRVWFDSDSSLTQNGAELGIFNRQLLLLPDSSYTTTDINGDYTFATTSGLKTVKVIHGPLWKSTNDSVQTVNVTTSVTGINFGIKGVADIYLVDASLTGAGVPRCNTQVSYVLTYTNTGTVVTHGEVIFTRSSNCSFMNSSVPPDVVLGNVYTWNYINLQPGETRTINVLLLLPGPGFSITNTLQVTARDPLNNLITQDEAILTQTVLCGFDPNDKTVIPEGVQVPHYTLMSDSLDFVIRFQNTGNDTAFNIVILDTLNKNILDLNTFSLIAYSHPVVIDLRPSGRVTFTFDNIHLPDSIIDEPGSHGFVRFRCLAKTGLPNNTILNNRAHIYFDLNPAVVTNTTLNTLVYQIPVGIHEADATSVVTVMPNPVTEDAIISFSNPVGERFVLKVYDSSGKLVSKQFINGERAVISQRLLHKGVFIYELKNETGSRDHKGKFVVL
jgi:uncharacterized repeat protein (TIGR01451 family)